MFEKKLELSHNFWKVVWISMETGGAAVVFSKKVRAMHSIFEILGKLSIATSINTRASKWTFQKSGEAFSHFLKPQMKFKN